MDREAAGDWLAAVDAVFSRFDFVPEQPIPLTEDGHLVILVFSLRVFASFASLRSIYSYSFGQQYSAR